MEPPSKRPKRNTSGLSSTRLFNTDSPLTRTATDIQPFLSVCLLNWTQYDEDERKQIISTMPLVYQKIQHDEHGRIVCPLDPHFVANDKTIRDQAARFKRDVMDGCYTKTWQERAMKAMEDRRNGKFDAYLAQHAAELFDDTTEDEDEARHDSSDGEYRLDKKQRKSKGKPGRDKYKKHGMSRTLYEGTHEEPDFENVDQLAG